MAQLSQLPTVVIDGREWWACPAKGADCGRSLVDFGSWGLDALELHVQREHPEWWWAQQRVSVVARPRNQLRDSAHSVEAHNSERAS